MKPELSLVVCPKCKSDFSNLSEEVWKCGVCGYEIQLKGNTLLFCSIPDAIEPFEKRERGAEKGTPWRQANWRFLENQVETLPRDAVILDVGAGHGDFSEIFERRRALYLDIFPYPEVDLACDLTQVVPFRKDSLDAIALVNVLEHVGNPTELISVMADILKPGGVLWITIPFLLKIHQAPYDFNRYTSFALERMARDAGLEVERIEGYFDPIFLLGEGYRNIEFRILPGLNRIKRYLMRAALTLARLPIYILKSQIGGGAVKEINPSSNPAPVGYQLILRKHRN